MGRQREKRSYPRHTCRAPYPLAGSWSLSPPAAPEEESDERRALSGYKNGASLGHLGKGYVSPSNPGLVGFFYPPGKGKELGQEAERTQKPCTVSCVLGKDVADMHRVKAQWFQGWDGCSVEFMYK